MSILNKVIKAVKKIFGISKKRRVSKQSRKTKVKKSSRSASTKLSVKPAPARAKISKVESSVKGSPPVKTSRNKKVVTKKPTVSPQKSVITKKTHAESLQVGVITHYFDRIKVCVIKIDRGFIKKGEQLLIKGDGPGLTQVVSSVQIENEDVLMGKQGQLVGLKVARAVSVGDAVFKLPKNG